MKARSVFRPLLFMILSLGLFVGLLDPLPLYASPTTIAAFTYDPCVPCVPPGDLVLFNANSSLALTGTIVAYTWDFGDGTPPVKSSSPLVSHDYYLASPSEWNVTLTVQDTNGLTDTIQQLVIFYVLPRFTFHPTRPMVGETTTFNASESISYYPSSGYNITGYTWNFGDGTGSHGEVVTQVYTASGAYRVILTLSTSSGNPSISQTIIVEPIQSVGGVITQVGELSLLFPYLTLASAVAATILAGLYLSQNRIKRQRGTSRQPVVDLQ